MSPTLPIKAGFHLLGGGRGGEEASPPIPKLNYRQRLTHGMLTMSQHYMLMTAPPRKRL